jgi:hypothetical protein
MYRIVMMVALIRIIDQRYRFFYIRLLSRFRAFFGHGDAFHS